MRQHLSYYRFLNEAEREMLTEFVFWLTGRDYAKSTIKLYRHLISKIIIDHIEPSHMTRQEATAWNRLVEYLETTV